jgi:pimeloyl-ACP methyl ester carboxylesterase
VARDRDQAETGSAAQRLAAQRLATQRLATQRLATQPRAGRLMSRRDALLSAAALALPGAAGCKGGTVGATGIGAWRELAFDPTAAYPEAERALLLVPDGAKELPLVVALHGRGESGRGLDAGARGFRDDYALDRVDARLRAPPITHADLLGFVTDARLAQFNASLAAQPYRGVVLATPYTPDLHDRSFAGAEAFARFVTETLIPRARSVAGSAAAAGLPGIDGVSMGGRLALWIGLRFPELFSALGAMQPALKVEEAPQVAALARAARDKAPKLRIRLLSSEQDPFLAAVKATSAKMNDAGVTHDLVIDPGPHDYIFNRGPGCAEMLLWQDRALRGLPSP